MFPRRPDFAHTRGVRVVIVMPQRSYRASEFLDAAERAGAEVWIASDRCHVLDRRYLWPERSLVIDFYDPDAAVATIVAAARVGEPVAAVIPAGGEAAAALAARAASELGLPSNAPEAMAAARSKRLLRIALDDGEVAQPRWFVLEPGEAAAAAAARVEQELGWPVVIKPLLLSGSRGVMRADDAAGLAACLTRVRALLAHPERAELDVVDGQRILVEAFVPGPEVALEGLLDDGKLTVLALFDKPDPLDGPLFEETLYVTPSRLPAAVQAAIASTTTEAAHAMGLHTGPVHAELRLPPGGHPVVIEVAARTIGGLCGRTLRFGTGMSLEELVVRHALGQGPPRVREGVAAGVMMLPIPARGVLVSVSGVEAAAAVQVPGAAIEDVTITARLGDELLPLPEGDSYLGFVFARGDTPAAVEAALRQAHRNLHFELRKTMFVMP